MSCLATSVRDKTCRAEVPSLPLQGAAGWLGGGMKDLADILSPDISEAAAADRNRGE